MRLVVRRTFSFQSDVDSFNRILRVTAIAIADELSSAAELVMEKDKMINGQCLCL